MLTPSPAAAQGPKQAQIEVPADGTELFRALLDRRGIKPIRPEVACGERVEDVIVVILGDPFTTPAFARDAFEDPLAPARNVLRRGGAVLIASEGYLDLGRGLRWTAAATITGSTVVCDRAAAIHQGHKNCPYLLTSRFTPEGALREVFGGLDRIATNTPSHLTGQGLQGELLSPLAWFPAGSRIEAQPGMRFGFTRPFAAGYEGSDLLDRSSRFLVLADSSVFINQMLIEPETDNLELAYRLIRFLQGPNNRTRCLFVENGRVIKEFDGLRKAFKPPKPLTPKFSPGGRAD